MRPFFRCLIPACLFSLLMMTPYASPAGSLDDYRWKKRVLVLLAPDASNRDLGQQRTACDQAPAAYEERDLIVLQETGADGPLHRRFHVPGPEFRLVLIGKDGHTALERSEPVANDDLFGLIDSMPMRREEMSRQKHP
ncbi:MAG TPA: DUF4174 domain-containing protein [Chthoniobacterales bacterium]